MTFDTLLIKHMPHTLSTNDKEEFLKNFGAVEVRCLKSEKKQYNVVFAKFPSPEAAENVLFRLHQLEILGQFLSVEYARGRTSHGLVPERQVQEEKEQPRSEDYYQKFLEKLNFWHSSVDFKQPIPNHLNYNYPAPTTAVLLNMAKILATVPKFYTQVLHLMNKMNLPCPFGNDLLPDLNLGFSTNTYREYAIEQVQEDTKAATDEELDTDLESEISTDEETQQNKEIVPEQKKSSKKMIKKPKFTKPIKIVNKKRTKTKFEDVFEKIEAAPAKKSKPVLSYPPAELLKITNTDTGFGIIDTPVQDKKLEEEEVVKPVRDDREEERLEKEVIVCIKAEELEANRIPEKDHNSLPVFKNYTAGASSTRLYIKNLSKTVVEEDLRFIYSRYITESSMLDIRLMTEGRMKGQAFVNLPTVEAAQRALKETNGYILKDKPIVVQFGRTTK